MAQEKNQPKNLDEALALIAELTEKNTNLGQSVLTARTDLGLANDEVTRLKGVNKELGAQVNMLQRNVGLSGTSGLPEEVVADIERRKELGVDEQTAFQAAIRQHTHNKGLEKKAKEVKEAKK